MKRGLPRLALVLLATLILLPLGGYANSPSEPIFPLLHNEEDSDSSSRALSQWQNTDVPVWTGGNYPRLWQPQTNGILWELDFSPSGEHLAVVDIVDNRLVVWNVTDGRTVMYMKHPKPLADVLWLNDEVVLAADSASGWYAHTVVDDEGTWPMNSSWVRTGDWAADMTGNKDGFLWGMDTTPDRSKVVFCGGIDDPNINGEVVVVDADHFLDGSSTNSVSVYTNWGADCAISPNGSLVASLNREFDSGISAYRDTVTGWNVADWGLSHAWTRNVAGGEAMAWGIDFTPYGDHYTIVYNRPTEGVIANYFHDTGVLEWYTPIPQNVSSLEWLPSGVMLGVGMHDPGRLLTLDGAGGILADYGWHSTVGGGKSYAADVTAIETDDQATRFATAGKDGAVEIHSVDGQQMRLTIDRRFGGDLLREISIHPMEPFVVFAESGGVVTVRDARSGKMMRQCFHPDFDSPVPDRAYAKSVVITEFDTIAGFSDGVITSCDPNGKNKWVWRIDGNHPFEKFGRIDMHPLGDYLAMSWTQDLNSTGVAGKVSILDIHTMTEVSEWEYQTEHWTMDFSADGSKLASAGQNGDVRMWETLDPDAIHWTDMGVAYSHANYTGVTSWHPQVNVLLSVGWDRQAILWDADQSQQMLQMQVAQEGFGATFAEQGLIVVASGDASTSRSGQVEFIDGLNMTVSSTWPVGGIPRGLEMLPEFAGLVVANTTGAWYILVADMDGDGVLDAEDAFPTNPLQWVDTDGDGYGDNNAIGAGGDSCASTWGTSSEDRLGCPDSDGDGWSDPDTDWPACISGAGYGDAFASNPDQWCDSDGDGEGDEYSFDIDGPSGLRLYESGDAFPFDVTQWRDEDGDGCGDNHSYQTDSDGIRIVENGDALPQDSSQCQDTDGDGYGDNYTWITGLDGLRIENGDAFWLDFDAWSDIDGDGCPTASATGLTIDNYPEDSELCDEQLPFNLPEDLSIFAQANVDGEKWDVAVDWKKTDENTVRVALYGLSWNSTVGMGDAVANLQPPGAMPWQDWTSWSTDGVHTTFVMPRQMVHDKITLRFIATSTDGQTREMWFNGTWVDVDDGGNNSSVGPDDGVDDGNENQTGGTGSNDPSSNKDDGGGMGMLAIVLVILGVLLLGVGAAVGLSLRGRSSDLSSIDQTESAFDDAPPATGVLMSAADPAVASLHPPCPTCGGPSHETIHQGDRWTWCPACRKWLSYLGRH